MKDIKQLVQEFNDSVEKFGSILRDKFAANNIKISEAAKAFSVSLKRELRAKHEIDFDKALDFLEEDIRESMGVIEEDLRRME